MEVKNERRDDGDNCCGRVGPYDDSVVFGIQRMRKKKGNASERDNHGVVAEFFLLNPGLVLVAFVFLLGTIVFLVRGELPTLLTVGASLVSYNYGPIYESHMA